MQVKIEIREPTREMQIAGEVALAPLKRRIGVETNLSEGQEAILRDPRSIYMEFINREARRLAEREKPSFINRILRRSK